MPLYHMASSMVYIVVAPVIMLTAALPVVIYIVARWRASRGGEAPDPQLGFKVVLSWFRVSAYQLLLLGGFLLLYGLIGDLDGDQEDVLRTAGGLLFPAFVIFVAHLLALEVTNASERPTVVRMFAGLNLVQTGLIGFIAVVFAGILLFQKDVPTQVGRMAWSLVLVYVPAWAIQGVMLAKKVTARSLRRPARAPNAE